MVRKETDRAVLTEDQIEDLKLAFEMFDEKEQGSLTKADLQSVCDKYGLKLGASAVAEMFKEADVTNTGKIGFPEFMSMMTRKMKEVSFFFQNFKLHFFFYLNCKKFLKG